MRIVGWGASDVGRKRHHNEDSFLCNNELRLFAVADGMGGHLGGERASRMAVEILEREIEQAAGHGPTWSAAPRRRPPSDARTPMSSAAPARRRRGRPQHLRGGAGQPRARRAWARR